MNNIDHFMITRINIGLYASTAKRNLATLEAKNMWMRGKLQAQRNHLLPCIKYQTNRDFKIVWLVDSQTPDNFVYEIEEQAKEIDATIIIDKWLTDRNIAENTSLDGDWLEKFRPMIKKDTVALTRFDSDDIMARNFMEVVKSHFDHPAPVCIDFWYRLTIDKLGRLYFVQAIPKGTGKCTPAVTCIEKTADFKSPFVVSHFKLDKVFPVKVYDDLLWCKPEKRVPLSALIRPLDEKKLEDIKGFEGIGF